MFLYLSFDAEFAVPFRFPFASTVERQLVDVVQRAKTKIQSPPGFIHHVTLWEISVAFSGLSAHLHAAAPGRPARCPGGGTRVPC